MGKADGKRARWGMRYRYATLEEVSQLTTSEPLMFDTETDKLYGKVVLAQFYQSHWDYVLLVRHPDLFLFIALFTKYHLVMHNASYDVSTVQVQADINWVPKNIDDTLYLSRLQFYKKHEFSLDKVMAYVLGYDPYEQAGLDKKILQKSNWNTAELTEDQLKYASIDVYYLANVYEACKEQRESFSYKLDMFALGYALDFQTNGFPVDEDQRVALDVANEIQIAQLDLPINVNSYKQVRPYIESDQSNALGLATLALQGNQRAANVNKARKLLKTNSFLKKFETIDGRIYGKFAPSARSGRFTCKAQNLQQLPRTTKGCFGTSTESGRILVYSDYPGLELRCACVITKDRMMEKLLREGADLHNYVAEVIFGEDFTPTQRQIAKTCNFNLLYGGGWAMLQGILIDKAGLFIEEIELKNIIRKWKQLFSGVAAWQQRGIDSWRHNQHKATPLGRRYMGKLMTDQLNIEVSGFGAEIAKLALHYMYPKLAKIEATDLVNFIHDSYIAECDIDDAEEVAGIISSAMQEAWTEGSQCTDIPDLPMPIEVTWGYNWKGIETDDYLGKLEIA